MYFYRVKLLSNGFFFRKRVMSFFKAEVSHITFISSQFCSIEPFEVIVSWCRDSLFCVYTIAA